MNFEPEDKQAWERSEVMRELERIAPEIYREADESFEPIKLDEDEGFEEEVEVENDDEIASELFGKLELFSSINKDLFDKIRTISYSLADRGLKKEAFKIERMLKDLNGRSK
jgi:hypothetical protein